MEEQNTQGQPAPGQSASPFNIAPKPKNWLVESILVTIFCCLPLGIVGIVNAANVNSRYEAGDLMGAQKASQEAGKWVKWGLITGVIVYVIYLVLVFVVGLGGLFMSGGYNA